MSNEFGSIVVDALCWSGISREPVVVQSLGDLRGTLCLNTVDFQQVCYWIDGGESTEADFASAHLERPRADAIRVYLLPRDCWGLS